MFNNKYIIIHDVKNQCKNIKYIDINILYNKNFENDETRQLNNGLLDH